MGGCVLHSSLFCFFFASRLLLHTAYPQSAKNLKGNLLFLFLHVHMHTLHILKMGHYLFNNNVNHIIQDFHHHAFLNQQCVNMS